MSPVKKWTMPMKTCRSCNSTIKTEICPHCGARQGNPVSKRSLLLAAFFCGGLGWHKFYLGKYWQGVLYFLFFTTGIPILIALIEFIIYAFTSSDDLNKEYSADSSPAVIILLVMLQIGAVVMVAKTSIQAHKDYIVRGNVSYGLSIADNAKKIVETNSANIAPLDKGWTPPSATNDISSMIINPSNGEITISYSEKIAPTDKNTLILSPRDKDTGSALTEKTSSISWSCNSSAKAGAVNSGTVGTIASNIVPAICR
jgi:TM2 domain-containing membrane protein YozV